MDPIRTAVKYSLIPLRTVVQLGELFVESGRETPPPPERTQAATKRRTLDAGDHGDRAGVE